MDSYSPGNIARNPACIISHELLDIVTRLGFLIYHLHVNMEADDNATGSKPLLKLKPNLTLVDYQIQWLQSQGFERIILASREELLTNLDVGYSTEANKLGTGRALKKEAKMCAGEYVYAMNVDGILLGDYDPAELAQYADRGSIIVIAKPRLKFGRVKVEEGLITGFEQKPLLGFYVSAGTLRSQKTLSERKLTTHQLH